VKRVVTLAGLAVLGALWACGTSHPFSRGPHEDAGVLQPDASVVVSFKSQVDPIFAAACVGCHGSGTGGLTLVGNPTQDYPQALAQSNIGSPSESPLYLKPTGQVSHGGGTVLQPDSDDAKFILSWIEQGCENN
jgi:mono/diheme cytochrome c family protein